jgi:hypothetical protein
VTKEVDDVQDVKNIENVKKLLENWSRREKYVKQFRAVEKYV